MPYNQRNFVKFSPAEKTCLLARIQALKAHPYLSDFDIKFLTDIPSHLESNQALSVKQVALVEHLEERVENTVADLSRIEALEAYETGLPPDIKSQLQDIKAWALSPGRSLTEKQRNWVGNIQAIFALAKKNAGDADTRDTNPDQWLRAMSSQCLAASDLLTKAQVERLTWLATKISEKGCFRLFESEVELLLKLHAKIQKKLDSMSEATKKKRAERAAHLAALNGLESKKKGSSFAEQGLLPFSKSKALVAATSRER